MRLADLQFKREGITGVAITGAVVNDCTDPVWGIIRLTFRDKTKVAQVEDIWPTGRETIPAKASYPVSWYFDVPFPWTAVEPSVVVVEPGPAGPPEQRSPGGQPSNEAQ